MARSPTRITATRPPAGRSPSFVAADGRGVWELESNLFLVQCDTGPGAEDRYVAVVFEADGITPRLWEPPPARAGRASQTDGGPGLERSTLTGVVWGLVVSLPLWAGIVWLVQCLRAG